MTTKIFFSSNSIMNVTNKQLQRVLDRFDLGRLLSAESTSKGVGKQTMFVRATSGEYVLKGNPLYKGQFAEEKFFVDNLYNRTGLPVPQLYLLDDTDDIFGWSYSLMSRMPGHHMNERDVEAGLSDPEKIQIATLLARSLGELHAWEVDKFGEYDPQNGGIQPFADSYKTWLYNRIRFWLKDAEQYSRITAKDREWVESVLAASEDAFDKLATSCFVMGDFKPDNFLLQRQSLGWTLSGMFDFTSGYFADGIADLPRMVAMYLEHGEIETAKQFIRVYFHQSESKENFVERFRIHMLHQWVLDWGCAYAIKKIPWDPKLIFSKWSEPFTESAAALLS